MRPVTPGKSNAAARVEGSSCGSVARQWHQRSGVFLPRWRTQGEPKDAQSLEECLPQIARLARFSQPRMGFAWEAAPELFGGLHGLFCSICSRRSLYCRMRALAQPVLVADMHRPAAEVVCALFDAARRCAGAVAGANSEDVLARPGVPRWGYFPANTSPAISAAASSCIAGMAPLY